MRMFKMLNGAKTSDRFLAWAWGAKFSIIDIFINWCIYGSKK